MKIFIDILTLLWQSFCGTLRGIGSAVYELLPIAMQLNKIAKYFTPMGMLALYLGVPTVFITIFAAILKRVIKKVK
jgi:hypothetical protein